MRMALIDPTGTVVGFLAGEVSETWPLQPGFTLQPDTRCSVGDTYAGTTFTPAGSLTVNRAQVLAKAKAAIAANAAYQGLGTPTTAQAVAQVALLTKECTALIRLVGALLDTTTGT
jgi:hypothetical protein